MQENMLLEVNLYRSKKTVWINPSHIVWIDPDPKSRYMTIYMHVLAAILGGAIKISFESGQMLLDKVNRSERAI